MSLRGLPARSPRVLVDCASGGSLRSAIDFYRPSRPSGRAAKVVLKIAERAGVAGSLVRRVAGEVVHDSRIDIVTEWASTHPGAVVHAAWLGSPGPHRKVTFSIGDSTNAAPWAYVKVAPEGSVASGLVNEQAALDSLSQSVLAPHVPKVLAAWSSDGHRFLALSTVSGRSVRLTTPFGPQQSEFLSGLAEVGASFTEQAKPPPGTGWVASHGDFTPWNTRRDNNSFSVFDWEFFAFRPLGWDVCHYLVQPASVMSQRSVGIVARRLSRRVPITVQRHLGCDLREAQAALAAYCSAQALPGGLAPSPAGGRSVSLRRAILSRL